MTQKFPNDIKSKNRNPVFQFFEFMCVKLVKNFQNPQIAYYFYRQFLVHSCYCHLISTCWEHKKIKCNAFASLFIRLKMLNLLSLIALAHELTYKPSNLKRYKKYYHYKLLSASFKTLGLLLLVSRRCNLRDGVFSVPFLFLSDSVIRWLSKEAALSLPQCFSVCCAYTFYPLCLAPCESTPSKFLESNFPRFPAIANPPPFPVMHMLFLFFRSLYYSESGMACVFHHRNRHNRPTQPSLGSANRDQIKSIIQSVCAKVFSLLPSLLPSWGTRALFYSTSSRTRMVREVVWGVVGWMVLELVVEGGASKFWS